jgi:hypothetical protein
MSRPIAFFVGVVTAVALPAWSQTQITTGVGHRIRSKRAVVPGATVEVSVDTNAGTRARGGRRRGWSSPAVTTSG